MELDLISEVLATMARYLSIVIFAFVIGYLIGTYWPTKSVAP